ncbi:MAG: hypothetical protein HPM95_06820 [Alphaproteobacteria bacterium]|nr:hypothetical protein [Alphaproteobacteria bacterium]
MQPAPSRIYVWGYTDPRWLARFARKRGIPLIRVEDGFLRSAELGASHATPYSLVFDSKGLYYNASEPNDLADILASYDFAGDTALMENARSALNLLIEKRLSKYNLPDVGDPARHFSIKTRRRVLVLGQVDNDAAVRMGNPAGWRMSDIVRLAKLENPDADILYRPHPDIYHGYQRSRFKAERIEKFARIPVTGRAADRPVRNSRPRLHASSLSGLEALLRGVAVTTLEPFYAGWGLTDDRTQEHRGRDLTVLELFAGVYLKYPRYLVGGTSLGFSFRSQPSEFRLIAEFSKILANQNDDLSETDLRSIARGRNWPSLLLNQEQDNEYADFFQAEQLAQWLRQNPSDFAHLDCLPRCVGMVTVRPSKDHALSQIREIVSAPVFNELILNLIEADGDKPYLIRQFISFAQHWEPQSKIANRLKPEISASNEYPDTDAIDEPDSKTKQMKARKIFSWTDLQHNSMMPTTHQPYLQVKNTDWRQQFASQAILLLTEIAVVQFDFDAAGTLADFLLLTGSPTAAAKAPVYKLESLSTRDERLAAEEVSFYLALKPEKIVNAIQALDRVCSEDRVDDAKETVLATVMLANSVNTAKVHSLLSLEMPEHAHEVAEVLFKTKTAPSSSSRGSTRKRYLQISA